LLLPPAVVYDLNFMIAVKVRVTKTQFLDIWRLHYLRKFMPYLVMSVLFGFPLLMLLIRVLVSVTPWHNWERIRQERFAAAVAFAITGGAILWEILVSRSTKRFTEYELEYIFSEEGMERRSSVDTAKVEWGALENWREVKEYFFLFYRGGGSLEFIPKHSLSSAEVKEELRKLLSTHCPKPRWER